MIGPQTSKVCGLTGEKIMSHIIAVWWATLKNINSALLVYVLEIKSNLTFMLDSSLLKWSSRSECLPHHTNSKQSTGTSKQPFICFCCYMALHSAICMLHSSKQSFTFKFSLKSSKSHNLDLEDPRQSLQST